MNYCKNCGIELKDASKFCANCGMSITEEAPETKNKMKRQDLKFGQKVCRFFKKVLLWGTIIIAFCVISFALILHFDVIHLSVPALLNGGDLLEAASAKSIIVEDAEIVAESDGSEKVKIMVQIPDYELLFKEASTTKDPEKYISNALLFGNYEVCEIKETVTITDKDVDIDTLTEELVDKIMEKELIDAINSLQEVE